MIINYIIFSNANKHKSKNHLRFDSQALHLLDSSCKFSFLELIPRSFTISNQNKFYKFNSDILKQTSSIILEFIENNPQSQEYHLEIDDEKNTLNKIEQVYQGKSVVFDEDNILILEKIAKTLKINFFNELTLPKDDFFDFFNKEVSNSSIKIELDKYGLNKYFKNELHETFTITTDKNVYKCNYYGILASNVLREYIDKNPTKYEYKLDYDDEFGDFQLICDIFNFKEVRMTVNNINSIKEISDQLNIEIIFNKIDAFIERSEVISNRIDDYQDVIDSIDELFEWLFHIKEKTVISVKNSIAHSNWCQTEDDIQELAASILQVVNTDIFLHSYLAELLVQLEKESNETNLLNLLVPTIVKNLMLSFGKNMQNCSFVFNLHKKGFITKDEIISHLNKYFKSSDFLIHRRCKFHKYISYPEFNYKDISLIHNLSYNINAVYSWFLPELIETNLFNEKDLRNCGSLNYSFIKSFLPDRIDEYKKMRDSGEPDDEITKALRNDDVDTLQLLISSNSNVIVPFNIYENYIPNGKTNYLNYSAACGSVKCFKYLSLNHIKCDELTFIFAVYGGNIEIIKIVDQTKIAPKTTDSSLSDYSYYYDFDTSDIDEDQNEYVSDNSEEHETIDDDSYSDLENYKTEKEFIFKILPSITKHQNDLFDWIFETKLKSKDLNKNLLNRLLINSVKNGNAHSIISIIDKGFDLSDVLFEEIIKKACENGFHKLSKIIISVVEKASLIYESFNVCSFVCFGNISIFLDYFNNHESHRNLENAFLLSVVKDHRNILSYIFENFVNEGFQISDKYIFNTLNISVMRKSSDLFFYLIENFRKSNPCFDLNDFSPAEILSNACVFGNFGVVQAIIDKIDDNFDFTDNFIRAASIGSIEICQYFLDKKVSIDFNRLSSYAYDLSSLNEEIFSLIVQNCNQFEKEQLLRFCLKPAIEKRNYCLAEYLLKEKAFVGHSLFLAVQQNDLKMVNIILKYRREPSFINMSSKSGTALCIAVKHNQLEIVKSLLSVPGINPSVSDHNLKKPIMLAFPNVEMISAILDFYGDEILLQTVQLSYLMIETLHSLFAKEPEAMSILMRILDIKNLPVNEVIEDEENFLTYACKKNNVDVVKMLLKLEQIDVNICIPTTGDTPLIIAIESNSNEVAELLIEDQRTNINARNYNNETAFTSAVSIKNQVIIELLLNNEKFNPIESLLDKTFYETTDEIRMLILSAKSFDINHTLIGKIYQKHHNYGNILSFKSNSDEYNRQSNYSNETSEDILLNSDYSYESINENDVKYPETILQYAVRTNKVKIVDFVIQSPTFDKRKSCFKKAIFYSIKDNNLIIFKKLLELINFDDEDEQIDLLSMAIKNNSGIEIIKEILNNSHFNSSKNEIFNNFCMNLNSIDANSYGTMIMLFQYDQKHDNLIDLNKLASNGETVFTSIFSDCQDEKDFSKIEVIVNFLLENGADPNIPNQRGKYPLQHAIELDSIEFVNSLIKSKKIDFSKRMKNNKTFLHLASMSSNSLILKEFLDKNLIDINVTDDFGETPLMDACRFNRVDNVSLLFKEESLDYLHRNKSGQDALEIIQDPWQKSFILIKNKDDYCFELLNQLLAIDHNLRSSSQIHHEKTKENSSKSETNSNSKSNLPPLKNDSNKVTHSSQNNSIDKDQISSEGLPPIKRSSSKNSSISCCSKEKVYPVNEPTQLPPLNQRSPRPASSRIRNLQNLSDKGDAESQYSLGICYALGKGVPNDKTKAFEFYLLAANQGHMNAQYSAAACYSYGKGTEIDKKKAFDFYLKSAEQGFAKAQFAVAHFYEFGEGIMKRNHKMAVEWYQKAANQGHKASIEALKKK
ncbi:hypothetical protein M9Y10_007947 [Tritrichomonas musculus]|uniref:Ankyrin repeat protein n=1 Tax=Tritrichomonas musculus TaxID=1915356 RepID=A0ABR2J3R8_9EUKA